MKVLALILAGGTGTRLGVLTETLAKPSETAPTRLAT